MGSFGVGTHKDNISSLTWSDPNKSRSPPQDHHRLKGTDRTNLSFVSGLFKVENRGQLLNVDGRDKVSQKWSFKIEPPILRKND